MTVRRYSVYVEDSCSEAVWLVCKCWTKGGMFRRIRRGNSKLRPLGVRFYGQIDR